MLFIVSQSEPVKHVFELDYGARSSTQLLNHIRSEAMHNVSAHQLSQYYLLQKVPSTVWTALVIWYAYY